MKPLLAFVLMLTLLSPAKAQLPVDPRVARSVTDEFIAYPLRLGYSSRFYRGDQNSLSLEPAVLVISCERIKQSLWRLLEINTPARGKIFLHLRPARNALEQATIVVEQGLTGWEYHIDVPDSLSPVAFFHAIIHASLLEIANRNAEDRAAQIPLWLAEGLSRELLATERVETLIPPPRTKDNGLSLTRVLVEQRRTDPLAYTLTVLRAHAPLTFEQLSWPDEKSLSGEPFETFSASAHLFIRQLLQMENGKTHLRETLDQLPRNFNWQFALLSGFKASFKTQLDVEKWWALQLVQFTGRDLSQAWTHDITWTKLDQILLAPMETRSSPAELPRHTDITLQAIIYNWDGFNQRKAIEQKLHELDLLRPFAAQSLISLVDDYRQLLGRYLQKQNFSGSFFGLRKQTGPIRNRLANETVKELNALDAKRMALKSPPPQPATETAATSPNGK